MAVGTPLNPHSFARHPGTCGRATFLRSLIDRSALIDRSEQMRIGPSSIASACIATCGCESESGALGCVKSPADCRLTSVRDIK